MTTTYAFVMFCFLLFVVGFIGAAPERENTSAEISSEIPQHNLTTTYDSLDMENLENVDLGPPDSHEAMNNREINPKGIREKRSFEFLMGLINRNSSYEVVKKEEATEKPKKSHTSRGTEILLDLLMKIARNQEQWNNVHQILQNLDEDLVVSRHLVKKFKEQNDTHSLEFTSPVNLIKEANLSENATPTEKSWPIFTEQPLFQNSAENENGVAAKSTENSKSYQKNFAYRRVTGKPAYLKKNPTAYIAVSVISPKTITSKYQDNEDILENELHRLKPWPPKKST